MNTNDVINFSLSSRAGIGHRVREHFRACETDVQRDRQAGPSSRCGMVQRRPQDQQQRHERSSNHEED